MKEIYKFIGKYPKNPPFFKKNGYLIEHSFIYSNINLMFFFDNYAILLKNSTQQLFHDELVFSKLYKGNSTSNYMPTIVSLPISPSEPLPAEFLCDVRYSDRFVEYCLQTFSKPNDIIFDPFAGFGTTLRIAEKMKRVSFGVEIEKQRVEYITSKLQITESIIHGDITNLSSIAMKKFDLLLTSPPYMNSFEKESSFENYQSKSNYIEYLDKLEMVFRELDPFMNKGGKYLIEVANLYNDGQLTTLAWDIATRLRKFMQLQREIIIQWEGKELKQNRGIYGYGYDHSYLLVFQKYEK